VGIVPNVVLELREDPHHLTLVVRNDVKLQNRRNHLHHVKKPSAPFEHRESTIG
jgi:hypothetical protein